MAASASRIASIVGADSAAVQALFADVVAEWRASGVRIAGVIAETRDLPGRTCAAGVLRSITSGGVFRIYLDEPPQGTSCHLDAKGVGGACAEILDQIAASDLLVLSKFGKLEAAGSGLLPAFEAAITAGKPVLTSVSEKHRAAWRAFAPAAAELPANVAAFRSWWERQWAGSHARPLAAQSSAPSR